MTGPRASGLRLGQLRQESELRNHGNATSVRVAYATAEGTTFPHGYPDSAYKATPEAKLAPLAESK